jgi:chromosome segregation ATPase
MPSPQVIERLQDIQKELEKASTAIKHVDDASKIAQTAADNFNKIPGLISDLRALEENHRKKLQKQHQEKIDEVATLLENIQGELKSKATRLSLVIEETNKVDKSIDNYLSEIKGINFPKRLDKIDNQISSINIGVGNLQTSIQHAEGKIDNLQPSIQNNHEELRKLAVENEVLKKTLKGNRIILLAGLIMSLLVLLLVVFIFLKLPK